jgi:hypothetical protein
VTRQLDEALDGLPLGSSTGTVAREVAYLNEHRQWVHSRAREPMGSGAVELTSGQTQRRFKWPG